jgi:hypothetical protein
MICPSCNQPATTFLRNSFSLQGVTLLQSFNGLLKCQHCGALLRNDKFNKQIWYFLVIIVIFIALVALFSNRILSAFGSGAVAIYWIVLVIMIAFVFIYGMYKYGVLEKVDEDKLKS